MGRGMFVVLIGLLAATPCLAGESCGAPATPCSVSSGTVLRGVAALARGRPPATGGAVPARRRRLGRGGASADPDPGRADRRARLRAAGTDRLGARRAGRSPTGRSARGRRCATRMASSSRSSPTRQSRFHLDRSRVFVTGFSMGAGLVWQLACRDPGGFAAYGPIAGGFWHGRPTSCAGPVRLLLTHGWRDDAVPIEGWEHDGDWRRGRRVRRRAAVAAVEWLRRRPCRRATPPSASSGSGPGPAAPPAPP